MIKVKGKGFFDKDILACPQGFRGELIMALRGQSDDNRLHCVVGQHFFEAKRAFHIGELLLYGVQHFCPCIAHGMQCPQFTVVANQVRAPISCSNDRDGFHSSLLTYWTCCPSMTPIYRLAITSQSNAKHFLNAASVLSCIFSLFKYANSILRLKSSESPA